MKASPQLSNATLASGLSRHDSTDIDYNTNHNVFFPCNVYEFPDVEDPNSLRSLGYQKPKHMWMAKDQALTGTAKPSNLTAAVHAAPDLTTTGCVGYPNNQESLPFQHTAPVVLTSFNNTSPTPSVYASGSPSTASIAQGLSVALSSSLTNTSSSLYSRTPPNSGHGFSTTGSASSCTSPGLVELQLIKHTVMECQSAEDPSSDKRIEVNGKQTTATAKLPSNGSARGNQATAGGRRKLTSRKPVSEVALASSHMDSSDTVPDDQTHLKQSRNKRQPGLVRRNSMGRKKRNPLDQGRLTLTLSLCSLSQPASIQSEQQDVSSQPCVAVIRRRKLRPSKSLPSQSPVVPGGLKIRLRRDSTPLDVASGRSKRARSKIDSTGTFRIVESWCDADAPGGEFSQRASATVSTSSSPSFALTSGSIRVGDIVWAKLAGYPYWPSRVSAIWARTVHQLSQAIPVPHSQTADGSGSPSLSVLATPADPTLAAGYTARVDWLAWDQCSYLSCAKLYPFKDAYDKLYNPRTRVKGYADAVRLAKRYCFDSQPGMDSIDSHLSELSPLKTLSNPPSHASAPASTDSQWSVMHNHPLSGLDPLSVSQSGQPLTLNTAAVVPTSVATPAQDTIVQDVPRTMSERCESMGSVLDPMHIILGSSADPPIGLPLNVPDEPMDLSALGGLPLWTPLPQLDVSGLGDFVSHVPTFSEDEDEEIGEAVTSQLQIDFDV